MLLQAAGITGEALAWLLQAAGITGKSLAWLLQAAGITREALAWLLQAAGITGESLAWLLQAAGITREALAWLISPGARCCVLEQDTSSLLHSTGSAQENVPAWLKFLDWDVKPQSKQTNRQKKTNPSKTEDS